MVIDLFYIVEIQQLSIFCRSFNHFFSLFKSYVSRLVTDNSEDTLQKSIL